MLKIIYLMKTTRDSRQPSGSDNAKYLILQMNAIKNGVSGALFRKWDVVKMLNCYFCKGLVRDGVDKVESGSCRSRYKDRQDLILHRPSELGKRAIYHIFLLGMHDGLKERVFKKNSFYG
jgi:hypothetical protein